MRPYGDDPGDSVPGVSFDLTPSGSRPLTRLVDNRMPVARMAAPRQRVEIRIEKVDDDATKLKIRVGAFGDESIAVATYSQINANL